VARYVRHGLLLPQYQPLKDGNSAAQPAEIALMKGESMSPDREILTALLCEVSRQSAPFQSLIHDYSADVMNDPEVHRLFTTRLDADLPMRREIEILKASLRVPAAGPLSPAMNDVLTAVDELPAGSPTSLREIADLAAVELVYKRREMASSSKN
jgi:hypothetical protein